MLRSVVFIALVWAASSDASAEQGRASHYGYRDGFNGRKTASGERFNAFAMTAAHRTRPMRRYAMVTNLANGRSVRVRINYPGPHVVPVKLLISVTEHRARLGWAGRQRCRCSACDLRFFHDRSNSIPASPANTYRRQARSSLGRKFQVASGYQPDALIGELRCFFFLGV